MSPPVAISLALCTRWPPRPPRLRPPRPRPPRPRPPRPQPLAPPMATGTGTTAPASVKSAIGSGAAGLAAGTVSGEGATGIRTACASPLSSTASFTPASLASSAWSVPILVAAAGGFPPFFFLAFFVFALLALCAAPLAFFSCASSASSCFIIASASACSLARCAFASLTSTISSAKRDAAWPCATASPYSRLASIRSFGPPSPVNVGYGCMGSWILYGLVDSQVKVTVVVNIAEHKLRHGVALRCSKPQQPPCLCQVCRPTIDVAHFRRRPPPSLVRVSDVKVHHAELGLRIGVALLCSESKPVPRFCKVHRRTYAWVVFEAQRRLEHRSQRPTRVCHSITFRQLGPSTCNKSVHLIPST
eukprot:scaffold13134_cov69-Phaeocystis_antarctica.AAC.4